MHSCLDMVFALAACFTACWYASDARVLQESLQSTCITHYSICKYLVYASVLTPVSRCVLQLKKVLSANAEVPLNVESLMDDKDVAGMMTRDQFEELAKPVIERVRAPLEKVGS